MFVVLRRAWYSYHHHTIHQHPSIYPAQVLQLHSAIIHRTDHNEIPVSIHTTKEAADKECRRLTLIVRSFFNPFWAESDPSELTSLDESGFLYALLEQGLESSLLPDSFANYRDWPIWWDTCSPTWTDDQCNFVWDLLDRIQLHVVKEIPFEEE